MHIPTREEHVSMNLGQAVAVCLYELARNMIGSRKPVIGRELDSTGPATAGELERMTSLLIDSLRASGYLGQRPVAAKEEKIRRMVRRLDLSFSDAEMWQGMLRQIVWKLTHKKSE
jgi:tRNA/rRNA methyltransferase